MTHNPAYKPSKSVFTQLIVTALMLAAPAAFAEKPVDIGKGEYEAACAVCHGFNGKDSGPVATQLKLHVPDLSVLAKANQGVFPFDRVYQIIDGRQEIKGHGTREMPVWGQAFRGQSSIYFQNYPQQDAESSARSRILALTEYVYRLQAK
jgi:mono/diheme cytochrome c family protein